jgi:ABC-type polysaccharide/polyol phosphate export permease
MPGSIPVKLFSELFTRLVPYIGFTVCNFGNLKIIQAVKKTAFDVRKKVLIVIFGICMFFCPIIWSQNSRRAVTVFRGCTFNWQHVGQMGCFSDF